MGSGGNRNIPDRATIKSNDPREISYVRIQVKKKSSYGMQIDKRAILEPIFKRYNNQWVEATGAIGVRYNDDFTVATLRNWTDCDLDIMVRVV